MNTWKITAALGVAFGVAGIGWGYAQQKQAPGFFELRVYTALPGKRDALAEPLRGIYGISDKVIAIALSSLLMGAGRRKRRWFDVGISFVAVDSLVHNFLHRTGTLRRLDAEHPYGAGCYRMGGCADVLRLAASLGATIARVPAEDVTTGLIDHISATRSTQLVIGKSRRSWWFELRHGSVVDRLLKDGPEGLALHVIPATQPAERSRRSLTPLTTGWGAPVGYGAALLLVAITTLVDYVVQPLVGAGALDLIYLLPVLLTAARYGLRPGLLGSVVAGLAYNFFFLAPLYTFTIADPQSVLTMFVLIGTAGFQKQHLGIRIL